MLGIAGRVSLPLGQDSLHRRDHRSRLSGACLALAAALLLAWAPNARAADPVPDDNSALDQYVESLPGASGDQAPAPRGGPRLPAGVRRSLGRSPDAPVLARLAAGAGPEPAGASRERRSRGERGDRSRPAPLRSRALREDPAKSLPAALADSVFSSPGGAAAALVVLLLILVPAAVALSRRRDEGSRGP